MLARVHFKKRRLVIIFRECRDLQVRFPGRPTPIRPSRPELGLWSGSEPRSRKNGAPFADSTRHRELGRLRVAFWGCSALDFEIRRHLKRRCLETAPRSRKMGDCCRLDSAPRAGATQSRRSGLLDSRSRNEAAPLATLLETAPRSRNRVAELRRFSNRPSLGTQSESVQPAVQPPQFQSASCLGFGVAT